MNGKEPYLTVEELAEHLRVSVRTVRNWVQAGEIPHDVLPGSTPGHRVRRFKVSAVEEWVGAVEGNKQNSYNHPTMGIYRRKTGKNKSDVWQYVFTLDGKRVHGSTGTTDRTKAKEIYIQTHNEALDGRTRIKAKLTLGEALDQYLEFCKAENKPSTYEDKVYFTHTMRRYFDPSRRLASFTVEDIERFKIKRKSEVVPRTGKPPAGATINRGLTFLQGMFTWAVAWGKLEATPFVRGRIKKYKEPLGEGKYLNSEQRRRLLTACSELLQPLVVTAMSTGMRLGEIKNLQWQQVNLDLRVIQITNTKSKRNRSVRMGMGLVEMFKRLPKRGYHVFSRDDGKPFSGGYISHEFQRATQRSGIMNFTFHSLRDLFATDFYQANKDLRKLQRVLGHSSIATTERYMATLGLEDTVEVDAISDKIFTGSVGKVLGFDL